MILPSATTLYEATKIFLTHQNLFFHDSASPFGIDPHWGSNGLSV